MTTSPSSRGPNGSPSSSIGNERTSVGLLHAGRRRRERRGVLDLLAREGVADDLDVEHGRAAQALRRR
jgi:hypothetical protein